MKTLLLLPIIALLVATACGGDDADSDVTASGSGSPAATASASPEASEIDTSDWLEVTDNDDRFTLLYPPDWFEAPEGNRVASFDVGPDWIDSLFPPDGVLVDFVRLDADALDERPDGSTDVSVDGADGYEFTEQNEGGGGDADWSYRRIIVVTKDDSAYAIYGAFKDPNADEAIFRAIVNSLQIND